MSSDNWKKLIAALSVIALSLMVILFFVVVADKKEQVPGSDQPPDERELNIRSVLAQLSENAQPFEFAVIDVDERRHTCGPQVVIDLQTTNEIAKGVSEQDLRDFWKSIEPAVGERRLWVYLRTDVPGAIPYGSIRRIRSGAFAMEGPWKIGFDISVSEFSIDSAPYYFVNKIDRSVDGQACMIVTLPMVNRLNELLLLRGWTVKSRKVDHYSAEHAASKVSVTLSPETLDVTTFGGESIEFTDTVYAAFSELGIAEQVKAKLHSVVGSPEYLDVTKPAKRWTWKIGQFDIVYFVTNSGMQQINAYYDEK